MPNVQMPTPYVWFVALPRTIADDKLGRCLTLLDEEERARAATFLVEPARHQFIIARALLRTVLSKLRPVAPADWRFGRGEHGKPFIASPADNDDGLWFSVSHTRDVVVVAVSTHGEIGVDVEAIGATLEVDHFRSCLSDAEAAALDATPAGDRATSFYALWTAKEAVAKAIGTGVSSAMAGIGIVANESSTLSRSVDARYDGWSITRAVLPFKEQAAVATRHPAAITFCMNSLSEWMTSVGLL